MRLIPSSLIMDDPVSECLSLVSAVRAGVVPEPLANQELESKCAWVLSHAPKGSMDYARALLSLYGIVQNLDLSLSGALHVRCLAVQELLWDLLHSGDLSPFTKGNGGLSGGGGASGSWGYTESDSIPGAYGLPDPMVFPPENFTLTADVLFLHTGTMVTRNPESSDSFFYFTSREAILAFAWDLVYWWPPYSRVNGQFPFPYLGQNCFYSNAICPRCGLTHGSSPVAFSGKIHGGVRIPDDGCTFPGAFVFPHFACIEIPSSEYPPGGFVGVTDWVYLSGMGASWGAWFGVTIGDYSLSVDDPPDNKPIPTTDILPDLLDFSPFGLPGLSVCYPLLFSVGGRPLTLAGEEVRL